MALVVVVLKPWDERKTPDSKLLGIIRRRLRRVCPGNQQCRLLSPSTLRLSRESVQREDSNLKSRTSTRRGPRLWRKVCRAVIEEGRKYPELAPLSTTFTADTPNYYVNLDRNQAQTLGASVSPTSFKRSRSISVASTLTISTSSDASTVCTFRRMRNLARTSATSPTCISRTTRGR